MIGSNPTVLRSRVKVGGVEFRGCGRRGGASVEGAEVHLRKVAENNYVGCWTMMSTWSRRIEEEVGCQISVVGDTHGQKVESLGLHVRGEKISHE